MGLVLKTAPVAEPVTLAEARDHLRLTDTNLDTNVVTPLIVAARVKSEKITARQFVTATWTYTLDKFPSNSHDRVANVIDLPLPPLASVSSLKYWDVDGNEQTLVKDTDYVVKTGSIIGRVSPDVDQSWPATQRRLEAVTIEFVAGYGAASAVPEPIKAAIKLYVESWMDAKTELEETADRLLAQFRVLRVV